MVVLYKRNIYVVLWLYLSIFFVACEGNRKTETKQLPPRQSRTGEFVIAPIPQQIKDTVERTNYLLQHYWDNFDFSDTMHMYRPELTEQAFVGYVDLFSYVEINQVDSSVNAMLSRTINEEPTGRMYGYFLNLFENYLYNPNSPMRNDEFYLPVVRYVLSDEVCDQSEKERAKLSLSMIMKNRKGEVAADFNYTLRSGKQERLHHIESTCVLLMFYNPDCRACAEIIDYLKKSELISMLLKNNLLKILACYPDKEISIWKEHLDDVPESWINGYDENQEVMNKMLYDLKAIPSLYLLDTDKSVLLKDADMRDIEEFLKQKFPMFM